MGGLMSVTGQPDGSPGGEPMKVGVAIADIFAGLYSCIAILAALNSRYGSGFGAHVDMALFDTQIAVLANQASNALVSGKEPLRQGNSHPNIVPYQPFAAADQPIIIAIGNDRQFALLAELCGRPEWAKHPRFATNAARVENRVEIIKLIADVISGRTASEWLGELEAAGIPAGPINSISQALSDVQAQHRAMVRTIGGMPLVGSPVRINGERLDSELPPPRLGEHTDQVLAGLGIMGSELEELRAAGVI
jgi:formyl-CoA transferase